MTATSQVRDSVSRGPSPRIGRKRRRCSRYCSARDQPCRYCRADHRGRRIMPVANPSREEDEGEKQERPEHIGRRKGEIHPALRAAGAILVVRDRKGRQADEGDAERKRIVPPHQFRSEV